MDFRSRSPAVTAVMDLLCCFEFASTEHSAKMFAYDCMWATALERLAVVIVRSHINAIEMFEEIAYTGFLGSLDVDEFIPQERLTGCPHDPKTMVKDEPPCFGFRLPHGPGSDRGERRKRAREATEKAEKRSRKYPKNTSGFGRFVKGDILNTRVLVSAKDCILVG